MTIYTAIFSDYDKLKHPLVVTPGWRYICYTDQPLTSQLWEIRQVPLINNDPTLTARYYKIMFHEHIEDDFSIWVDGSFTIACNLDQFVNKYYKSPMTCVKHPIRNCIYREADACIQQKRGDWRDIERQVEFYREFVPKSAGLIQSGILLREKNVRVEGFCQTWWNEIQCYSTRDQISFTRVANSTGWPHLITLDYRNSIYFRFHKHIKK